MQKHFETHQPAAPLRPYVEHYWSLEFEAPMADVPFIKIIPYGHVEFAFQYGDPFLIRYRGRDPELVPRAIVGGQLRHHILLQPTGGWGAFAIRFQPSGLYGLTGLPMTGLTDQTLDLVSVFGREMQGLSERILPAADTAERIRIAEEFLLRMLARRRDPVVYAHHAVRFIRSRGGRTTVAKVCRKMGIGERQLEREFKEKIGLSPKYFIRITRLNNAFRLHRQQPALGWAALAFESGYADQAHFIREFRAFAGETPERYFAAHAGFAEVYQGG